MKDIDSIRTEDEIAVSIFGPDGSVLYKSTGKGYHNLEMAVNDAISRSQIKLDPKDCVFEVSNLDTGVTHRYRLNAHGHLKLII